MSLLDSVPFDSSDPGAPRLHNLLTRAYVDTREIMVLTRRIGLRSELVNFNGSASAVWWEVLQLAAEEGKLRQLVEAAASDYPQLQFQSILTEDVEAQTSNNAIDGKTAEDFRITKDEPVKDSYYFLTRLGLNWSEYPFSWE